MSLSKLVDIEGVGETLGQKLHEADVATQKALPETGQRPQGPGREVWHAREAGPGLGEPRRPRPAPTGWRKPRSWRVW
jgi:hypothetical protein